MVEKCSLSPCHREVGKSRLPAFRGRIRTTRAETSKATCPLQHDRTPRWDAGAAWEDLKFDVKHFADIDRLAMVGDKKWQHGMAIFFKPFTKAATRYFDESESAEARKWLDES